MNNLTITYYGHSCFKVSSEKGSVVLDPYADGSVPGLTLPKNMTADAVFCSHGHEDHNAADLIRLSGKKNPFEVSFITTPHDHHEGSHRGMSRFTFLKIDGITVAHLGDLGRLPTKEEYSELAKVDVVMIPCAGYFTISSEEAAQILPRLKSPSLKILMHFRDGSSGYEVQEDIKDILKVIPGVKRLPETEITIDFEHIPDEIITMKPLQ